MEQSVTGNHSTITVDKFQDRVHILVQDRDSHVVKSRDMYTVKAAKRLVKYIEAVIAEVEEEENG